MLRIFFSVSAPFCTQAQHTLSALAQLEEVDFSTVRMHLHKYKHKHGRRFTLNSEEKSATVL